jgi:alkane 1-monooxygenase
MSSATTTLEAPSLSPLGIARLWAKHLTALYIPGIALLFLWTGPHAWYVAPFFMVPMVLAHQLDCGVRRERRQPAPDLPAWPFDALVYLLAGLQFWVIVETVRLFSVQGIFSLDMVMVFLIVGGASGFSIITAHELIHRKRRWEQELGRALLCTVLYEHFYTEHLRGHHVRVGTPDDPATARFGEAYESFFRRTVPAQLRSAWRLEKQRLGDADMKLWDRRTLSNRVLHGLVLEWGLALAIFAAFGGTALFAFLLQAFVAVRLLEAVNYFEHWGLVRAQRRVRPVDSWDTHSWFTFYGLVGLSRHADHHAWPARPYQQLRVWEEAPVLPYGYVGMVDLVIGKNDEFQRLATQELGRARLGPFAPGEDAVGAPDPLDPEASLQHLEEVHAQTAPRSAKKGPWQRLPVWLRRSLVLGGVILVATLGVQWETGAQQMGFAARLLLHAWVLAAFAGVIWLRARIEAASGQEALSWAVAFGLLLVLGRLSDAALPLLG